MFTFLAFFFIALLLVAIYYGYGIVMRRPPSEEEMQTETCSLCRQRIDKTKLIEREVGDSRVFYFCPDCIQHLYNDLQQSQRASP